MSGVKATLKVVLQANDTVVAESEDAALWQRVLLAINKGNLGESGALALEEGIPPIRKQGPTRTHLDSSADDEVSRFAEVLGISSETLVGACAPAKESPYLTLDMHCWNTLKEQTPPRGQGSVSPMALAGTLLALWMQTARLGNATQAEAQKVLGTINLRDSNAVRSIKSTEWLQGRAGGVIVVNPAKSKKAVAVARAFCEQDWSTGAS